MLAWLTGGLLLSGLFIARTMAPAFRGPGIVQDDARQHVFWMSRWSDPALFPNDPIAEYFAAQAPAAYAALYWLLARVVDPLTASKLVPPLLGVAAAVFTFLFVLRISRTPSAAFLATILGTWYVWQYDDLPSGSPRAFLLPLLAAQLWLLASGRRWPSVAVAALGTLFYPTAGALMTAVLGARLVRLDRWPPRLSRDRADWLAAIVAGGLVFLIMLPTLLGSRFGPTVTADAARAMPEFGPGGRNAFFFPDPYQHWIASYRGGLDLRVFDVAVPGVPILFALAALAALLPMMLLIGRFTLRDQKQAPDADGSSAVNMSIEDGNAGNSSANGGRAVSSTAGDGSAGNSSVIPSLRSGQALSAAKDLCTERATAAGWSVRRSFATLRMTTLGRHRDDVSRAGSAAPLARLDAPVTRWDAPLAGPASPPARPDASILVQVLLASFGLFFLAHLVLFRLYLPSRFVQWSLPLVLAVAAGIGLAMLIELLTAPLRGSVGGVARSLLPLAVALGLTLYPAGYDGNFVVDRYPRVTAYLRARPPETLVAAVPTEADSVPSFAQRPVLTAREYALAYHTGYYAELSQRTRDLIDAYYTDSPRRVQEVVARYGIDVFLVNRAAYDPVTVVGTWAGEFEPYTTDVRGQLRRSGRYALLDATRSCGLFTEGDVTVVPANCFQTNR